MIMNMNFDTHSAVKKFIAAGMKENLAETLVSELQSYRQVDLSTLASKDDTRGLRMELKGEIGELRSELKAEISELRVEMKAEISELRSELKAEISELRSDIEKLDIRVTSESRRLEQKIDSTNSMIKWIFAVSVSQTAILIGVMKYLLV